MTTTTIIIIVVIIAIVIAVGVGVYFVCIAEPSKPKGYKTIRHEQKPAKAATEVIRTKIDEASIIHWLDMVDETYIQAFQFKQLGTFAKYANPSLCSKVQHDINYRNTRLWGTKKYRIRKWEIVSVSTESVLVRKELTFKKIKFGYAEVPMGDRCVEYWQVETLGKGKYRVVGIQDSV